MTTMGKINYKNKQLNDDVENNKWKVLVEIKSPNDCNGKN